MSALENPFPFVDRTSQTRETVKKICTNFDICTLSYFYVGKFECPVAFVLSCVHGRLRARESYQSALPKILVFYLGFKCEDMAQFSVCHFLPVGALSKLEKCWEMLIMIFMFV